MKNSSKAIIIIIVRVRVCARLYMHTGSRWDFADTQRERAAVMRRSIHVLGILCFRLPALLRCLVTTKRDREGNFGGKYSEVMFTFFTVSITVFPTS